LRCPPSTKQHSPERASRGNYGYRNCGSVRLLEFGGSRRNTGPYSACCLRRRWGELHSLRKRSVLAVVRGRPPYPG